MISARELTAFVALAAFLALLLSCEFQTGSKWSSSEGARLGQPGDALRMPKIPDFGRYQLLRTLSEDEFPLNDPDRRVIMIGDIHGMYRPLTRLLTKLDYDPNSDVLVQTGDFLVKGLHHHSIATLDFMALHNVTGVRGNHDQEVLEWRGWIDWINSSNEGTEWLKRMERNWKHIHNSKKSYDLDQFLTYQRHSASGSDKRWWKLIPPGWKFLSDPYRIARDMTKEHYEYLVSLPLALYIPSAHTFVVHAGILPSDPRYPYYDRKRQPLAHIPGLSRGASPNSVCSGSKDRLGCMKRVREAQDLAILSSIPQNKHPWVLLNMRGVKRGKVFRKYKGTYWAKSWNKEMRLCAGYEGEASLEGDGDEVEDERSKRRPLPCYPSSIVYGHSAARGFSPKRWSVGLDSGCVYGRKLTAIVLGGDMGLVNENDDQWTIENGDGDGVDDESDDEDDDEADETEDEEDEEVDYNKRRSKKHKDGDTIRFGVNHQAKIATVKCP